MQVAISQNTSAVVSVALKKSVLVKVGGTQREAV